MPFQSSPVPKGRCYPDLIETVTTEKMFQSSPAPKGRCYDVVHGSGRRSTRGFNPHRPRRAGATLHNREHIPERGVSILTGPEGPVLPQNFIAARFAVSFQSSPAPKGRCYGNVGAGGSNNGGFNPHRPRRAGATGRCHKSDLQPKFQSSPAPKGRCYGGPLRLHRLYQTGRFNPHRPRRAGATPNPPPFTGTVSVFQSSPAPKGRCYCPRP